MLRTLLGQIHHEGCDLRKMGKSYGIRDIGLASLDCLPMAQEMLALFENAVLCNDN